MSRVTDPNSVREQYERFPFPPLAIGALAQVRPPQADAAFAHWYVYGRLPAAPLRILDAGCGTGFSTLKLAEANPQAEIVALDFSAPSLQIARERLAAAGLAGERIALMQADLQQLPELGRFDYIHCSGVIHHLPDPEAGLRGLRACLAPRGLAYFMAYSAHARYEIQAVQQVLYQLWQNPQDWDEGLMLCRTFFRGLPVQHPLKQHFRRALQVAAEMLGTEAAQSDAFFVDTWLQRCEQLWSQPEFYALLQRTDWQPARWLDEDAWKLETYLPGLPDYVQELAHSERLALVDRLRPPQNFALFVTPELVPRPALPLLAPEQCPLPFGSVQVRMLQTLEVLDNGRGTQLSLNAITRTCWEMLDGQRNWQEIWDRLLASYPGLPEGELKGFSQQLLEYGFVGIRA
ncbi:MAG: hypothetical protein CVV27_17830 [Candidatus Melainabacteria bacterium HGW-Melainabacteria-1]|nr:MAG: hypothetical protein CVV27_17830 [Candidatus Melainabacteria bacterium HGW-Melainabacteria-1]